MISTKQDLSNIDGAAPRKTFKAFRDCVSSIWIVPAVAVVVAILIIVIGHARLSQVGTKFLGSFIYAMLIGFPTATTLNWIGFRYTERFPRFVFVIHTAVLIVIAIAGSLSGAFVLKIAGLIHHDSWWTEVQSSLPVCLVITLVVGLSITSFETMRHRLQDATLELRTRQVEQERANKLLVEARLSSLESRIHPHFLFNALNTVYFQMDEDVEGAKRSIEKFSELLRYQLYDQQCLRYFLL